MKKLFFLLFGVGLCGAVMAQANPHLKERRETTMQALREDVRAHEATKRQVGDDLTHIRIRKAFKDHGDVARTHKLIDADRKRAIDEGIDHPISRARREVHAEDRARG
jgi:hypothetical protein